NAELPPPPPGPPVGRTEAQAWVAFVQVAWSTPVGAWVPNRPPPPPPPGPAPPPGKPSPAPGEKEGRAPGVPPGPNWPVPLGRGTPLRSRQLTYAENPPAVLLVVGVDDELQAAARAPTPTRMPATAASRVRLRIFMNGLLVARIAHSNRPGSGTGRRN